MTVSVPLLATPVTPDDLKAKQQWLSLMGPDNPKATSLPFSFMLGDRPSSNLLAKWQRTQSNRKLDDARTEHLVVWTDPESKFEVRWVVVDYAEYPTVDWTLHFKNGNPQDAPPLHDVQALNLRLDRAAEKEFTLHAFKGSQAHAEDYAPRRVELSANKSASLASRGKSCSDDLPFCNLEWGGQGIVVAVGWPGSWTASFNRDAASGLSLQAGMTRFDAALHPGEEVRSPLMALQFWKGADWIRAQNVWRHWMVDHNLPRVDGKPPAPFTATCIDGMFPGMLSNAADEIKYMTAYADHHSNLDYFWIDAGWYPAAGDWSRVGTWEPDPKRYPKGIKQVSDAVHARGMKLVVWHEPERVTPGAWLDQLHPEWLLGNPGGDRLVDLGNPEAWKWVVEHFDGLINSGGIDLYRQDFNTNPAGFWEWKDKPGRIGMTEMNYVEGYLVYWDELRRRHPNMLIDSCAGGGQRNDLETLRRSVPLLRSDYRFEPNGTQGHNYGISFWMPFNGTGVEPAEPYVMRSHFCACFAYGGPCNDPHFDFDGRNRIAREWREVADNFVLGDYYPLTDYTLDAKAWMGWQFDRPEAGHGVVQIFRRSANPEASASFKLRGLNAQSTYEIRDSSAPGPAQASGRDLMEKGLAVTLDKPSSAATISYSRLP